MDDPRWLRLITIGLVLAALAVGYFLLTGRLFSNSATKKVSQASPSPSVLGQNAQTISTPRPTPGATPTPASAYNKIVSRTQNKVQVLPKTAFPAGLAVVFSVSAIISGWSLRKYPH